jgi:hypothetical protein
MGGSYGRYHWRRGSICGHFCGWQSSGNSGLRNCSAGRLRGLCRPARLSECGLVLHLDADAFAPGSHVLKAVALDTVGNSSTNQVGFITASSPLPSIVIDAPAADATLSAKVALSGWAVENTDAVGRDAVQAVTVFVDGNQVGTATYGTGRPDVCALFPGRLGCPNIGWVYDLDVSSLALGSHVLKVAALNTAGKTAFSKVNFTVAGSPASAVAIDAPAAHAMLAGKAALRGHTMKVADVDAVPAVNVFVDGNLMGTATSESARPDAWTYELETAGLSPGGHILKVVAVDAAGDSSSSEMSFTAASTAPAPSVTIDEPAAGVTVNGNVGMRGWAMEKRSDGGFNAVQSVAVFVDGNQVGTATYGTARPDVCGVFPARQGCPNVGWIYNLEAAAIPEGSHVLKLVATDAEGRTSSVLSTFLK